MNVPYYPSHGGANRTNRSLLEGLAARGHAVSVVAPSLGTPPRNTNDEVRQLLSDRGVALDRHTGYDSYTLDGVRVCAVVTPGQLAPALQRELAMSRADVVLASSEDPSQLILRTLLECGTAPVVYIGHTPVLLPFGPFSFFASPARRDLLARTAARIAVSEYVHDYFRDWGGMGSTVLNLYNFKPAASEVARRHDRGFITLINPCTIKGISIFSELARSLPGLPFAAVPTWGTTSKDLQRLAAIENVTLLSPVDDVREIFRQTRLLLVPSLCGEAYGRVAVEALVDGLPVLVSDFGGLREAVQEPAFRVPVRPIEGFSTRLDENMIPVPVVPSQDVEPWALAIKSMLESESVYQHHVRRARRLGETTAPTHDWAQVEEFLERVSTEEPMIVHAGTTVEQREQRGPAVEQDQKRSLLAAILARRASTAKGDAES
ncbi:MAG: glycosyltransferase family 4 protein [Bacteroidota bacterium]